MSALIRREEAKRTDHITSDKILMAGPKIGQAVRVPLSVNRQDPKTEETIEIKIYGKQTTTLHR